MNWNLTGRINWPAVGRIVYVIALISLATYILWETW